VNSQFVTFEQQEIEEIIIMDCSAVVVIRSMIVYSISRILWNYESFAQITI